MITAFLDACVLVPISLTNVILTAAEHGLIQPYWSPTVEDEAVKAIQEVRPALNEDRIRARFDAMDDAFEGACISGDPSTMNKHHFPDPDDKHVAAAAISAGASIIVTANLRDFPGPLMDKLGLTIMTPDELLQMLLAEDPELMVSVIVEVADALQSPTQTPNDILTALRLAGAPRFAVETRDLLRDPIKSRSNT